MIKYKNYFIILLISIFTILILKNTTVNTLFYNKTFLSDEINFYDNLQNNSKFSDTPYINLNKGNYRATFKYSSEKQNSFNISVGKDSYTIVSDILPSGNNEFSVNFDMRFSEKNNGFKITTFYNGEGNFTVDSIKIEYIGSNINAILIMITYIILIGIIIFRFTEENYGVYFSSYISIFYLLLSSIFIQNIVMLLLFVTLLAVMLYLFNKRKLVLSFNFNLYCFFVIFAFIVMFFCTKSSPFYIFNDWNDSQSYFTMGKGLFNGKILYKELFEQKGPLFYFIYGIGYLICNVDFYGVYFLEAVFFSVTLIFMYKLSKLFLTDKWSFVSVMTFAFFILNSRFMKEGGSAEQFLTTFESISLYYFIRYFKQENYLKYSPYVMFIHGIVGASVLLIKINVLGFWIGFGGIIFLDLILKNEYELFFKNIKSLILGVLVIIVPFLIYFLVTKSFKDFIEAYIVFNSKYAPIDMSSNTLKNLFKNIISATDWNYVCSFIIAIGILGFSTSKSFINNLGKTALIVSIGFLIFFVYAGTSQTYYFGIVAGFSILGIIFILSIIQNNKNYLLTNNVYIFYTVVSLLLCVHFNGNYKQSLIFDSSITAQEKFALIMYSESDNPTLLNIRTLDNGFYTKANIIPNIKFFQRQNISYNSYPDNDDIQNDALLNKKVEFVVYRSSDTNTNDIPNISQLNQNYDVISKHDQYFRGVKYRYYLYKAK